MPRLIFFSAYSWNWNWQPSLLATAPNIAVGKSSAILQWVDDVLKQMEKIMQVPGQLFC